MSNLRFRLALLLVTLAGQATAEPAAPPMAGPPQQVSLRYRGEAGCPSEAEFVDEVTARVRLPVQWTEAGGAVWMVVVVKRDGDQASGTLEVVRPSTEPTRREFTSNSCAEVGSALALVAALALDPNARTEQLPLRPVSSESSAPPVATEAPPVAPPPSPPSEPPSSLTAAAATSKARAGNGYSAWLGPAGAVAIGYASEPVVAVGFSLGARAVRSGFSPGFQLTPLWGKTGTTGPETTGGTFAWAMGRLDVCPLHLSLARPLAFEPCAAVEIGQLSARGAPSAAVTPDTKDRWWLAAGASFSLHLRVGSWFARLGASALFPATRDVFVFRDPDRTIQQARVVVPGASLGLGFQFGS